MKRVVDFLKKRTWLERLWLVGPIALWFSYQPLIHFGQDATSNYEISVTVLYALVLALIGIPTIWRARRELLRDPAAQLSTVFVVLSVASLLWTANLMRGVLTAGMIGMLYLVLLTAIAERRRLQKLLPVLAKLLVGSAVVAAALAFLQMIAGIWLERSDVLLCAGCGADQFGFVRPNVFAIEPQFLGSLFIAPLLILLRNFFGEKKSLGALMSFVFIASALFATLSRGAIAAFVLGALVLFVLNLRKVKYIFEAGAALLAAFAIALLIQGSAAALNPRVDVTFYEAVSSSISQLTLGKVQLPVTQDNQPTTTKVQPVFNGYVEESTDVRLSLTQLALDTWRASPSTVLVGVGVGGTGAAIHAAYPDKIDAREIVQNEYSEILLEYGLVGLASFLTLLVGYLWGTRRAQWPWAFLGAYAVQWWFFSGYPNALHVYLVLIALFVVYRAATTERHVEEVLSR